MKYALTLSSFMGLENLEQTLEKISNIGFDALEIYGEPQAIDIKSLSEAIESFGLEVCGVTGMWGANNNTNNQRVLLTEDKSVQRQTENYVKDCIRMCRGFGGKHVNICLFSDTALSNFSKTHRFISPEIKTKMQSVALKSLKELAEFGSNEGVTLVLEPLNRYSTPFCCNANDATSVIHNVDHDNMRLMLDTFHMNIEESRFDHSIVTSSAILRHMHFADNNRKMPGYGHIDFNVIMRSLQEIDYGDYITFEPTVEGLKYEPSLRDGLSYIRSLEFGNFTRAWNGVAS